MGKQPVNELTEAEWAIIQMVWEREPVPPAPTVQELLQEQRSWSYRTVKTLMDRMVKKGLLTTEHIQNLMLYTSAITQKEAQGKEILKTLKRAFEGALTPMLQCLLDSDHISHSELDDLEAMINQEVPSQRLEASAIGAQGCACGG